MGTHWHVQQETNFVNFLYAGLYDVLVVRQLAKPLTEPECRAVEQYVTECAAACVNGGEGAENLVGVSEFDPRARANVVMKAVQGFGWLAPCACLGTDHERCDPCPSLCALGTAAAPA
jgi:hypothetical protein